MDKYLKHTGKYIYMDTDRLKEGSVRNMENESYIVCECGCHVNQHFEQAENMPTGKFVIWNEMLIECVGHKL